MTTDDVLCRWEDFQAVMEEREPKMLRAFTAMEVDASGRLKTEQIQRAHVACRREQSLGDVMIYRWPAGAIRVGSHSTALHWETCRMSRCAAVSMGLCAAQTPCSGWASRPQRRTPRP